jgi:hypothetical protein
MKTISSRIDEIILVLEKEIPNAEEAALNTLLGVYSYRIFNKGNSTDGSKIGDYKEGGYKNKTRKDGGYQVGYVDLQLTGGLFFSIVIGESGQRKVLGYNNIEAAKIAGYNEERYKKDIFKPSIEEQAIARNAFLDYLREKIQELFNSW